jgi:hypothetical protein
MLYCDVESKLENYHIITFPGQSLSKNRETQFGRDYGFVARQTNTWTWLGSKSQGLRTKTEVDFTYFIQTFASLKITNISFVFLVITRNKNNKLNCRNLNFLLLIGLSTFSLPRAPHKCKSRHEEGCVSLETLLWESLCCTSDLHYQGKIEPAAAGPNRNILTCVC